MLFGAPGVGKGTQGKLLGQIPGMKHLATGDMFRALDKATELGKKVNAIMASGALVPDELTVELWHQHLQQLIERGSYRPKTDLLVLDGIPRSLNQAQALKPHLRVLGVLHLTFNDLNDMVRRMKRRALQENRPDDADENVIRRRFEVYERETRPVLSFYDQSLVRNVNAIGTPAEVLLRLLQELVPVYLKEFGNPLE